MENDIIVCPHCGAAVKMPLDSNLKCVCEYCKSILREGMTPEELEEVKEMLKARYLTNGVPVKKLKTIKREINIWDTWLWLVVPALLIALLLLFFR